MTRLELDSRQIWVCMEMLIYVDESRDGTRQSKILLSRAGLLVHGPSLNKDTTPN